MAGGLADIKAGAAFIELYLKNSKFLNGLKQLWNPVTKLGLKISAIGGAIGGIGGAITAPLIKAVNKFAEGGDKLDKMSGRTGVAVAALAELGFAAEQSGQDIDVVEASLKKMQKTIGGAITGGGAAADAFKQLGLSISDLQGMSPDQQFELIADRISKIQDPTLRAAAAMEIFGKNGTALLPMMEGGAAGIRALRKEAQELGIRPTRESTKMAAAIVEAMNRVNRVIKSTWSAIGSAIAPDYLRMLDMTKKILIAFQRWIKEHKNLFAVAYRVGVAITMVGTAIVGVGTAFAVAGIALGGFATVLTAIFGIIGAILSPIGLLIVGAVGGVAAFLRFTSAGQALTAFLGEKFATLLDFVRGVVGGISDALMAGDLTLAANIAWQGILLAFYTAKDGIMGGYEDLKVAASLAWSSIKLAFIQVLNPISGIWDQIWNGMVSIFDGVIVRIRETWNSVISWISKQMLKLYGTVETVLKALGLIAAKTDIKGAISVVEEENRKFADRLEREKQARDQERGAKLAAGEKARADSLAAAEKERADALNAFQTGGARGESPEVAAARTELERLRQQAADAAKKSAESSATAGDGVGGPGDVMAGKGSVASTFSAAALMALGAGGGPMDKLLKVNENQKAIQQKQLETAQQTTTAVIALNTLLALTP